MDLLELLMVQSLEDLIHRHIVRVSWQYNPIFHIENIHRNLAMV